MRRTITLLALAPMLTACRHGVELHTVAGPAPVLPPGWTAAEARDHSVTVSVPPGWHMGVDTGTGLADVLAKIGSSGTPTSPDSEPSNDPQMQQLAQRAAASDRRGEETAWANLAKKGIVLQVINGSRPIPGEQRTRFYVRHTHASGPVYTGEAIEAERKEYAFPPHPTEVKLPIGTALRFAADTALRDGMTLHKISYVILNGPDTYTLRFVTEEDGGQISSIAAPVAESLRIRPG